MVRFKLEPGERNFFVHRSGENVVESLEFIYTESGINVRNEKHEVKLSANLTLNDQGECKLLMDGKELDEWQFRRRALEELFFTC